MGCDLRSVPTVSARHDARSANEVLWYGAAELGADPCHVRPSRRHRAMVERSSATGAKPTSDFDRLFQSRRAVGRIAAASDCRTCAGSVVARFAFRQATIDRMTAQITADRRRVSELNCELAVVGTRTDVPSD